MVVVIIFLMVLFDNNNDNGNNNNNRGNIRWTFDSLNDNNNNNKTFVGSRQGSERGRIKRRDTSKIDFYYLGA